MKNQKWIKWITGITGALVFTGFVEYINANGQTQAQNGETAQQQDSQQTDQYAPYARRDMDNDGDRFFSDHSFSSSDSPAMNDSTGSGDEQTVPQQNEGRMRTRAS